MRILVINGIDWVGGAEQWIVHLVGLLRSRGHAVGVVHHPGSPLGGRAGTAGARTITLPAPVRRGGLPTTALWLAGRIRQGGWEVVVSTVRRELKLAGLATRLAGQPGVVARLMSGWAPGDGAAPGTWRWRRHRWYHRRFVHLAATNSRAGRDELVARGTLPAERIVPIHNGVDVARFDPDRVPRGRLRAELGIPLAAPLVVSISRYAEQKGRTEELEALGRLAAARPELHVVFAGPCRTEEQWYRGRLRARASHLAAAGRIRLLDDRSDVPELLADADVLVRAAREEGLPNIALEAMAMRVPVVATAICGTPEAVADGETGRLVPPADPGAIERAVGELLDAPAEARAAMGARARSRVERDFTLDGMADGYERLFARALAERSTPR